MAGYFGITLVVYMSVRPFVFSFWADNSSKCKWIFTKFGVCIQLILWRSGLRLLMGKFCQFLTELSAQDTSIFSFPDNDWSKNHWIFTKLGFALIHVLWRSGLGLLIGKFRQFLAELSARDIHFFVFR